MRERRAHPRVQEAAGVKVTILSSPEAPDLENRTFACETRDISARGLCFSVDTPLPPGAALEMRMSGKARKRAFWHVGSVQWRRSIEPDGTYLVGVRFTQTPQETLEAWELLMQEKLARAAAG